MIVKDTFQIYESGNSKLIKIKLSRLIGLFSIFFISLSENSRTNIPLDL